MYIYTTKAPISVPQKHQFKIYFVKKLYTLYVETDTLHTGSKRFKVHVFQKN